MHIVAGDMYLCQGHPILGTLFPDFFVGQISHMTCKEDHPAYAAESPSGVPDVCGAVSDTVTTTSECTSSLASEDHWDEYLLKDQTGYDSGSPEYHDLAPAMIVFDYDDTLFPTTFLANRGYRLEGPMASAELQEMLDDYSCVVEATLREAEKHGQVVILTNAETGWIPMTAQKFMPQLADVLERYASISARSTYEPLGIIGPFNWKLRAFQELLARESVSVKSLLSIGDSTHERDASHLACADTSYIKCKSIKFIERPDLQELTRQHKLIQECLNRVVYHDDTLDLCILNQELTTDCV